MIRRLLIVLMLGMMGFSVTSAQITEILIVEGNTRSEGATSPLNPLFCSDASCQRLVNLLFPYLVMVDPETGWLETSDDRGLVESWEIDGNTVTYTLRDDVFWSDGTPITAYDVFYSYYHARETGPYAFLLNELTVAAAALTEQQFQVVFNAATCTAIPQMNFAVIPSHVYDPDLIGSTLYTGGDVVEWFEALPAADAGVIQLNPEYDNPTVTAGIFTLVERQFSQSIDLLSTDGQIAYRYVDFGADRVDRFLRGELNLLVEPPYTRLHDLRVDESAAIYTYPGNASYLIALNYANPRQPLPAFDENGDPVEQIPHPILSDPVVREAMQLALDVPAMIDAAVEGNAVPLAGVLPPGGFGFDPELQPVTHDLRAAQNLLFDNGWRDTDGDGVRECLGCATARSGSSLAITLLYFESAVSVDNPAVAVLFQKQMQRAGIRVELEPIGNSPNILNSQRFDAVLLPGISPDDPLATTWEFLRVNNDNPTADSVNDSWNFTSYYNPEVERLLDEADRVPECDADMRRDLYRRAEAIVAQDRPFLPLFSPNRTVVSRQTNDLSKEAWEQFLP